MVVSLANQSRPLALLTIWRQWLASLTILGAKIEHAFRLNKCSIFWHDRPGCLPHAFLSLTRLTKWHFARGLSNEMSNYGSDLRGIGAFLVALYRLQRNRR